MAMSREDSASALVIAIVLGILALGISAAGFAFWPFDAAAADGKQALQVMTFLGTAYTLPNDACMLIIVACAGALGGVLHAMRSLYWYVGNGEFKRSWTLMYVLLPLTGSIMGIGFYLIFRGGLMSPAAGPSQINPYGMTAVAFLFGLFSQQAALKLKDVFETFLASPAPGQDSVPQGSVPSATPGFTLKADPLQNQPAPAGTKATFQIEATALGGLTGDVDLKHSGVPAPGTAKFLTNPVALSASTNQTTLEIDTTNVPAGAYPVTITGTSGGHSQTATVTLNVSA